VLIEPFSAGDGAYPEVDCDSAGNAVAVWYQSDGAAWSVAANRYTKGVGWDTAVYLEATTQSIYRPFVAVEPGGNATALWSQHDGTQYTMYANTYTVGTGWGAPVPVEQNNTHTAYAHAIGGGPDGAFMAVGQFQNSTESKLWLSHYRPGSGWGALFVFDPDANSMPEVRVGLGPAGQWTLAWLHTGGNNTQEFFAGQVAPGTAVSNLSLVRYHNVSQMSFAQSLGGGAVALWQERNGSGYEFVASRLTPGQGWSAPALVFSSPYHIGVRSAAGINRAGDSMLLIEVYIQLISMDEVWASSLFEPYAPTLFVTTPAEGAATALPSIRVAGTTEPGATVRANGVEAAVDGGGAFEALVPLQAGANLVTITASDARGNRATAWVNVTFNDPVPGLTAQLAAANANLSAAQLLVNQSQARLTALEADANATQTDLDAARANLTAAQSQVTTLAATSATLQASLNAAVAAQAAAAQRIAALEANLATTSAALNTSEDRIDALENRPIGGDSGLALILAAVAIAVGFAALAASIVRAGPHKRGP